MIISPRPVAVARDAAGSVSLPATSVRHPQNVFQPISRSRFLEQASANLKRRMKGAVSELPSLLRAETQEELFDRTGVTKLCSEVVNCLIAPMLEFQFDTVPERAVVTAWRHLLDTYVRSEEECSPQQQLLVKVMDARRSYKQLIEENKRLTAKVGMERDGVSALLRRAQEHLMSSSQPRPDKLSQPTAKPDEPPGSSEKRMEESLAAPSPALPDSDDLLAWLVPNLSAVQSSIGKPPTATL